MKDMQTQTPVATETFISPEYFLSHWQGHRKLTRRVIEAFPDDKLFTYSLGGMRPFSALAMEMLGMGVPSIKGALTRNWDSFQHNKAPETKQELLQRWDATTAEINELFPQIPVERFAEIDLAFGQWEGPIYWLFLYCIDNEIHHRGQGYVYLRTLGIEPPHFWER